MFNYFIQSAYVSVPGYFVLGPVTPMNILSSACSASVSTTKFGLGELGKAKNLNHLRKEKNEKKDKKMVSMEMKKRFCNKKDLNRFLNSHF